MNTPSKTLQALAFLFVLALGACGSSSGGADGGGAGAGGLGGAAGGKGAAGAGGSAGSVGAGGAAGSGGVAGSGAAGAGGAAAPCNALTSSGWNPAGVHKMAATGSPPAPAGGSIADGTYILTREDVYPPDAADTVPVGATIAIAGNQEQYFMSTESIGIAVYIDYSISESGTTLTDTVSCASSNYNGASPATVGSISTSPYTATATTLLLFNGNLVQTFTKQ